MTDPKGFVVFDSQEPGDEGKDYSNWRNIYLTTRGGYGTRTSHETGNPNYSVLHISAPIQKDGTLLGVLTLAKPTTNINFFLQSARPKIMIAGGIAALSVMFLGIFVSLSLAAIQGAAELLLLARKVSEIVERFRPLLKKKNVKVRIEVPAHDRIEGETFLVEQALTNVIQNALEFSPGGSALRVHGAQNAKTYQLSVEDGGPGIPEYALSRVFEKFYSLPRPETGKKSTGLGLSFVREIMALHHGNAEIENRPEGGSRVTLSFPLSPGLS